MLVEVTLVATCTVVPWVDGLIPIDPSIGTGMLGSVMVGVAVEAQTVAVKRRIVLEIETIIGQYQSELESLRFLEGFLINLGYI